MIKTIIQAIFPKIKIQSNMSEQEKKGQRTFDLLNAETQPKFFFFFFANRIQSKEIFFTEKSFLRKRGGVED